MDDRALREALENTGLTQYQADAYLALLELGSAPAADIAETSGVPGPRIYDVLRDLEDSGHVELFKQGRLHARVHDPSSILETLEARQREFEAATESIEERWERPDIDTYAVSIVKRIDTALERAERAIARADNQVKLCVGQDAVERFVDPLEEVAADEVHLKVCLSADVRNGDTPLPPELDGPFVEVRWRDLPAPFLAIVDRDTVCFAPHQDSTNEYGVIVNDPSHAYVFNVFFLTSLWAPWEPIYTAPEEGTSRQYVDIRRCVHDVDELLERGVRVRATVLGTDVRTNDEVELGGEIVDTGYDRDPGDDGRRYPLLNGVASLTLATDDGDVMVGGWGATLEDVEATRVTIEDVG